MTRQLELEIESGRREISADSVTMSISELTNLYREGVLEIRPEFQRLYRWQTDQKSRLVESVLLGIPLPSLFVSQTRSGKWELVDGLQRVSVLLELQGLLPKADGNGLRPPLILESTKYLPSLEGKSWNGTDEASALTEAQKLDIRLARLDLRIIKRDSDPQAKFDLFQRLNSFGSTLTPQEVRSAMIAGTNSECLAWLTRLSSAPYFTSCVALSERLIEEQFHMELVLRFMMLHNREMHGSQARLNDFATRLDDWAVDLAMNFDNTYQEIESTFEETFQFISDNGGEEAFRKWDEAKASFRGPFLNTSFEVIALGIGHHVASGTPYRHDVLAAARELWQRPEMAKRFATGLATQDRFLRTIPLGRELMADPPQI